MDHDITKVVSLVLFLVIIVGGVGIGLFIAVLFISKSFVLVLLGLSVDLTFQ